jgi:hypothetical protein
MAIFFIKDAKDPNITYHGKVLPKDAKKPTLASGDTLGNDGTVIYGGKELPRDEKPYSPPGKDLTNNPSLTVIGGITLPADTAIYLNGKKTLAISKILDGVSVVERISREPYEIEFECVLRQASPDNTIYIFPQEELDNVWSNVWLPDSVQKVQNTYLNKLGVQEIIIDTITPTTIRGSKNIPLRIHAYENVPGQTLIVS